MDTNTESHSKPLILVSASDLASASVLISELVDDKVIEYDIQITNRRKWQIINKYYRVDVEIYLLADDDDIPSAALADQVEAHIIFITDKEMRDGAAAAELAERRRARCGAAPAVCVLAAAAARAAPALLAWARRRRYEPVPLRQIAADDSDADDADDAPFPETYGVARVRATLHAHAWRGLERLDRPAPGAPPVPRAASEPTSSDSDYEGVEDGEDEDEAAVERAEAFAEALGALGAAGEAARGAGGGEGRLRRAELLVAAFCRALGADAPLP